MPSKALGVALALSVRVVCGASDCDGACLAEGGGASSDGDSASLLQYRAGRSGVSAAFRDSLRGLPLPEALRRLREQPGGLDPAPLQPKDLEFLRRLNSTRGRRASRSVAPSIPDGWRGPRQQLDGELWGGPSLKFADADFDFDTMPSGAPQQKMNFAGPGSDIPEGLWGIWWMDQHGASTVARDPDYPFCMQGTPEMLASFGGLQTDGDFTWGARYEAKSRCVTPTPMYGGPHWAAMGNKGGKGLLEAHRGTRNTLSFCFTDDSMKEIQIYAKMLTEHACVANVEVGPTIAYLLGFIDAGNGYSWTPNDILDMKMVKTPWGWDRVSTVFASVNDLGAITEAFLYAILPSSLWELFKLAQTLQEAVVGHYPLLQVVDGNGQPTPYLEQYTTFLKNQSGNPHINYYAMPKKQPS